MKRKRVASLANASVLAHQPFWSSATAELSVHLWQPDLSVTMHPLPGDQEWHRATCAMSPMYPHLAEVHADHTVPAITPQTKRRRGPPVEGPQLPVAPCVVLVHKYRLRVNAAQRRTLGKWMDVARWVYNEVVSWIRANKPTDKPGRQAMRDAFVKNTAFPEGHWALDVPNDVRAGAYRDALDAYDTNMAKHKKDSTFTFELGYRLKKGKASESIYVCSRTFHVHTGKRWRVKIYPTFMKRSFTTSPRLPSMVSKDSRLQRDALGHYYICIPEDRPLDPKAPSSENQARVVALDPGVRTFQTGYDPHGKLLEFGKGDINRIERLCKHLDTLQSKCADVWCTPEQRTRMSRAATRLRQRIRNIVDDVHRKTAHYLTTHYDLVLLPTFQTSKMTRRAGRKITSKTARAMLTWAHYRFQQRLIQRGKRAGCDVRLVSEAYTSKTCGACGALHPSLKLGDASFACPSCYHVIGRDANGARNILLRNAASIHLDVRKGPNGSLSPGTTLSVGERIA